MSEDKQRPARYRLTFALDIPTGLARVKFDIPDWRPQRFRLVYRQVDEGTRHVIAIGFRDEHAIYRTAVRRVAQA